MTLTILCAGALALPGGSDPSGRAALLARHGPAAEGAASRLVARAGTPQRQRDDALAPLELPDERWLRERFEPPGRDAIAAFAATPSGDSPCMVARPVHLHAALDHVVLVVPSREEIASEEAADLMAVANRLLAEDGLRWSASVPHLWTLHAESDAGRARLEAFAGLHCRSARLAAGRNVHAWLPDGPAARQWRALLEEMQMLWFDHPVNRAREEQGRPTLNSVWLEGHASRARRRAFDAVLTADEALAGLAISAGSEVSTLAAAAPAEDFARLAVIQDASAAMLVDLPWWRHSALSADPSDWQAGWRRLDVLIERLAAAGRAIETLVLTGERDLIALPLGRVARWKLWRRHSLADLLADGR